MLPIIATKEDFAKFVEEVKNSEIYKEPLGFGIARVDRGQKNPDKILQAVYPVINWKENYGSAAIFLKALDECSLGYDKNSSE